MTFNKIIEEVDVNTLSSKKENLLAQLDKISKQESQELQKAMDAIKNKYNMQKQNITKQISDIDKNVVQTASTLQQQQKQKVQQVQPQQINIPVNQQSTTTVQPVSNNNQVSPA